MERGNRQCSAGKARTLVAGGVDTNLVREGLRKDSGCGCLLQVISHCY